MTKQVIIVVGSPRKNGNSATLAEQAASGARAGGASVEMIYLHELSMEPCTA
jgi:multimeric flavodoxin WrbA